MVYPPNGHQTIKNECQPWDLRVFPIIFRLTKMCQIFMRQEAQASFMPVRAALKSGLILEKLNYWTVY